MKKNKFGTSFFTKERMLRYKMSRSDECERCGEVETYKHLFENVENHGGYGELLMNVTSFSSISYCSNSEIVSKIN